MGVWHLIFKPCALFGHHKNILAFPSIVCLNRGPKTCMVVKLIISKVQSLDLTPFHTALIKYQSNICEMEVVLLLRPWFVRAKNVTHNSYFLYRYLMKLSYIEVKNCHNNPSTQLRTRAMCYVEIYSLFPIRIPSYQRRIKSMYDTLH